MSGLDPERLRAENEARWERAASGWARRADSVRSFGMPVSMWMIDQLALQPGQRVLELAAGPGDTGFMAAELVQPGGSLICSDGSEPMLEIARERAREQGIDNVEFRLLGLEWLDLETATVDAALCRWGLMFPPDPSAALQETRRVLRPGGRAAFAVWDAPELNPWATIPMRVLLERGHLEPPDPSAPGMFALADRGRIRELFESAGFTEVVIDDVDVQRQWPDAAAYVQDTGDLNAMFAEVRDRVAPEEREAIEARIAELCQPFVGAGGELEMSGRSVVIAASA